MSGVLTLREGLTGREVNSARSQINVLRYIAGHVEAHGYAPSVRKIAGALGRTSFGGVHGDLEAAQKRASEAETALSEIRMRRSLAVSKGNRRRAELERARIRETTQAVRDAVRRKRQPQESLPL